MKTSAIILFFILCFSNSAKTHAQYLIPRSVLANGGTTGTNTQFQIAGTIGQAASGPSSSGNLSLVAGFWGQVHDTPVSVESPSDDLPATFRLDQNYPNPFNPTTTIRFALPIESMVRLEIFNIIGQKVRVLLNVETSLSAGWHVVQWNGLDDASRPAASGIYLYRLHTSKFVETKRMILIK